MKKVLFATTALVATAGIASAQGIEITGSAEMGIIGGTRHGETQFLQSVDVRFAMTGETDNGLTFGATIDLDDLSDMAIGGSDPVDIGGTNEFADFTVFLSGSFGTLTMGDTDGALDWALTEVNLVGGSIDDSETFHGGFNGNGYMDGLGAQEGQVARYDYSFGDFAFAVSAELDDTGVEDPNFGIGGKYSGDLGGISLGVGLGYQTGELAAGFGVDAIGVSVTGSSNGFTGGLNYTNYDFNGSTVDHWGIGFGYSMDALSIGVNYGVYSFGAFDNAGFGLAVNYDLGGGAVAQFGYGSTTSCEFGNPIQGCTVDEDSFSLGIAMSF
ncbi:MAG: porin [Rhodobacter sp.]|jgi:outer membrane protein OmpU|nr:porin [Rhodobacter sp.]